MRYRLDRDTKVKILAAKFFLPTQANIIKNLVIFQIRSINSIDKLKKQNMGKLIQEYFMLFTESYNDIHKHLTVSELEVSKGPFSTF